MTATTTARVQTKLLGEQPQPTCAAVPNGAAEVFLQGTLVAIRKSDGRLVAGATATGLIGAGRCKKTVTHASADTENIEFEMGVFLWENHGADAVVAADRWQPCYIVDNQTVAKTDGSGTRSKAGIVWDVTSAGVYVLMSPNVDSESEPSIQVLSLAVGFADMSDADGSQTFPFAAALPAEAIVIGYGIDCTAVFDNVGDTATVTADLGINGGDTDVWIDGASLNAIAKVSTPSGTGASYVGAVTPALTVAADVNVDTLTKGACTAYIAYILAA